MIWMCIYYVITIAYLCSIGYTLFSKYNVPATTLFFMYLNSILLGANSILFLDKYEI